jgi:hypothetical protein
MSTIDSSEIIQLKASLSPSSSIVTPDLENYEQCHKRWSDGAEKRAVCTERRTALLDPKLKIIFYPLLSLTFSQAIVVYPTCATDVATTVLFSQANSFELAVVCGGHSTGGASSTDGGLCLDLSKMRDVSVDPEKMTITAQGGALWSDVDTAAAEYGLATVGGTVNHTGVGGLTLGGGIGWLSCTYGLVIDNLLEVEIVLASGKIVRASETDHTDLFWAVRGAGVCFGVVTSFVFKAHEQKNPIWAGLIILAPPVLTKVIEFANRQMETHTGKHGMILGFGCPPPAFQPVLIAGVFYNGTESEGKKFFAPLLELSPLADHTGIMPYPSLNTMVNAIATHGDRKTWKGSAFLYPLDPKVAEETFNDFVAFVQKVPDAVQSFVIFEYFGTEQITKIPPTATAYANRGAYCNVLIGPRWVDQANDIICRGWARELAAKFTGQFEKQKKSRGVDKDTLEAVGQYGNYDGK